MVAADCQLAYCIGLHCPFALTRGCDPGCCVCGVQTRETLLFKILKNRIQPYVDGNTEAFEKEIHREADKLAAVPFGVPLLHIIGCGAAPAAQLATRDSCPLLIYQYAF